MVIETRCFYVIIWGRITAVGHIGHKVIMLGIVAPAGTYFYRDQDAEPLRNMLCWRLSCCSSAALKADQKHQLQGVHLPCRAADI